MADAPNSDQVAHLEELAAILQRRRRILEIQRARLGDLLPAPIVLELEDTEQQFAQVQQSSPPHPMGD